MKTDHKAEGGDCRLSLDNIDSLDFFFFSTICFGKPGLEREKKDGPGVW